MICTCLTFFDSNPEFVELLIQGRAEFPDRMRRTWLTPRDDALGAWQELYRGPTARDYVQQEPAEAIPSTWSAAVVLEAVFGRGLTESGRGPDSWVRDVLDVILNGIPTDAAQATDGCPLPSDMPTSAASEGSPHE